MGGRPNGYMVSWGWGVDDATGDTKTRFKPKSFSGKMQCDAEGAIFGCLWFVSLEGSSKGLGGGGLLARQAGEGMQRGQASIGGQKTSSR